MKITKSELKEMLREALIEELSKATKLTENTNRTLTNVFGETFTIDEWEAYLETDKALVDKYIMVVKKELTLPEDNFYEEVEKMNAAWNKYKQELPYPESVKARIEKNFNFAVDTFLKDEDLFDDIFGG